MPLANAEPLMVKVKIRSKALNMITSLTFGIIYLVNQNDSKLLLILSGILY